MTWYERHHVGYIFRLAGNKALLRQVAARVTEMVTRIKVKLPSAFLYQTNLGYLVERAARLPP